MPIHPTAVIDKHAEIDATADIGPYVVVDGPVRIGPGTRVYPFAYLSGWTEIGAECRIHPGAVVGHLPQDFAYQGAETYCRIGDGTVIREQASVHRGTDPGSATVIGRRCFLMATSHVGHNCTVGDDVKITNGAMLGGHAQVGAGAFISGGVTVHQFVRVGELAMIAGLARIIMDIPPYFMTDGSGKCAAVNTVGIRRAELTREERNDVKRAYRVLYRSGTPFRQAVERLADAVETDPGRRILAFCQGPSRRGIAGACGRRQRGGAADD